jgi:hypothetical protein
LLFSAAVIFLSWFSLRGKDIFYTARINVYKVN